MNLFSVVGNFVMNGATQAQAAITAIGAAAQSVGNSVSDLDKKIDKFGKEATDKLTKPIMALGSLALGMSMSFEDSMAKINVMVGSTEAEIHGLREGIVALSNDTGVSTKKLAGDIYDALSAGQDIADVMGFVTKNTNFAKVGFAETSDAVDLLTTVMNAYSLESKELDSVTEKLINTQDKGKITVTEMAQNFGRVIPTAAAVSVNLDNITSSYALMTKNGAKAADTTTGVTSLLNELSTSGSKTDEILRGSTGKSFKQLMESGLDLADVLSVVNKAANRSGVEIKDMFSSATGGRAALTLVKNEGRDFKEILDSMGDSAGIVDKKLVELETTGDTMRKAFNRMKNTLVEFGDIIMPVFADVMGIVTEFAKKVSDLDEDTKRYIVTGLIVLALLGPTTKLIGVLRGTYVLLGDAIGWVVSNPMVAMKGGLVALNLAVWGYVLTNKEHVMTLKTLWAGLKTSIMDVSADLMGGLKGSGVLGDKLYNFFGGDDKHDELKDKFRKQNSEYNDLIREREEYQEELAMDKKAKDMLSPELYEKYKMGKLDDGYKETEITLDKVNLQMGTYADNVEIVNDKKEKSNKLDREAIDLANKMRFSRTIEIERDLSVGKFARENNIRQQNVGKDSEMINALNKQVKLLGDLVGLGKEDVGRGYISTESIAKDISRGSKRSSSIVRSAGVL